jgi:hypothetical protein
MEGWFPEAHEILAAQTLVLWSRREDARRNMEDCKRQLDGSAAAAAPVPIFSEELPLDDTEIDSNDASMSSRKSPSMKRAYRQIALHTHPDKTPATEYTRRTFEYASKSMQGGDALGLAATWLRIDRTGFMAMPLEEVEDLKLLLDHEEEKIKTMRGTVAFNWNRMSSREKEQFVNVAGSIPARN